MLIVRVLELWEIFFRISTTISNTVPLRNGLGTMLWRKTSVEISNSLMIDNVVL